MTNDDLKVQRLALVLHLQDGPVHQPTPGQLRQHTMQQGLAALHIILVKALTLHVVKAPDGAEVGRVDGHLGAQHLQQETCHTGDDKAVTVW